VIAYEHTGHGARDFAPIPQVTRDAVNRRANGCCEDCDRSDPLELHHLTYRYIGLETPGDLDALCRHCHRQRHVDMNGDFWADPEEMADHWWGYDNEMDKD